MTARRFAARLVLLGLVGACGLSWAQPVNRAEELRSSMAGYVEELARMDAAAQVRREERHALGLAVSKAGTPAARESAKASLEALEREHGAVARAEMEQFWEMVGELESSMHGTMREALAADARLEELMALARDAVDWEAWPADVGYERHTRKFRPARTLSGPAIRLSYQRHTTAQGREVFLFQPQLRSKWGGSVKLGLFSVVRDREGCFLVALGGPGEVGPSHTSHWILGFVDGAGDMPDILTYTGPDGRVGDVHVFRWRYDSDMTSWERALVMQRDDFWGLKYPDAAGRVELRYRPKTEVRVASYDPATGAVEDHLLPPEDK